MDNNTRERLHYTEYLDEFLSMTGKEIVETKSFSSGGTFEAVSQAEKYCKNLGFDIGSMQRNAPRAIARDASYIAKWRNINSDEYNKIQGLMISDDFRNGEVQVHLFVPVNEQLEIDLQEKRDDQIRFPNPNSTDIIKPISPYLGFPCAVCGKSLSIGDVVTKAEIPIEDRDDEYQTVEVHAGCHTIE